MLRYASMVAAVAMIAMGGLIEGHTHIPVEVLAGIGSLPIIASACQYVLG